MKPRCPFRMKAFDQPDECDESCAWLVFVKGFERMCAVTVAALQGSLQAGPVNYYEEGE